MKALMFHQYGPPEVLHLEEIEKPIPKEKEVLVKVRAASLNAADWHVMRGEPFPARLAFGLFKPNKNILGADVSGVVESVGAAVTQFKPGDAVYGDLSAGGFGGFAEFVCRDENVFASKPADLSFEEAASVPLAAVTALKALRDRGGVKAGKKVLINGASGGVGTFAVQIAKLLGAHVTAVCSTGKMEMIRSLGADHVIDYTKENFTQKRERYDMILGANGYHPITHYKRVLNPGGKYVMIVGTNAAIFEALLYGPALSVFSDKKLANMLMVPDQQDLFYLNKQIDSGKIRPVIDRSYSFEEIPEAMRYLEEGHARGKIVIPF